MSCDHHHDSKDACCGDSGTDVQVWGAPFTDPRWGIVCTTEAPLPFDTELHAENRRRLTKALRDAGVPAKSFVLLQGGPTPTFHETDHEPLFRQESNFNWLFGVKEPDVMGLLEVDTGAGILFFPNLPESYATWMGRVRSTDSFQAEYKVEEVHFDNELVAWLRAKTPAMLLTVKGTNSDSGTDAVPATFKGIEEFTVDTDVLYKIITGLRAYKTCHELKLMRFLNVVSSEAHMAVMRNVSAGKYEYQAQSVFQHWTSYYSASRHTSYTCICASGNNGSALHYGHAGEPNARIMRDGDMCLFDMGAELYRYGSDITCSFPLNGKFTDDQKLVYTAVMEAQRAVILAMKPGVSWIDMHTLAYRTILTHLRDGGLLTGDVDEMLAAELGGVFMPHGLGHFLGIDTHDPAGYLNAPARIQRPGYRSLRTTRTLEPGMVITVEPGCYFNDYVLDRALADSNQARFINTDVLARFRNFGGVRLEDDVVVTESGVENLTWAPRTVADVEAVMAGTLSDRRKLTRYL